MKALFGATAMGLFVFSCLLSFNNSYAAETASVLPKNIFRARVVFVSTDPIAERFQANGRVSGLSSSLNQNLKIKDLAKASPALAALEKNVSRLAPGADEFLLNSQVKSNTVMEVDTSLLAIEYGINERLTFGLRAPITRTKIESSFEVTTVNNAKAVAESIGPNVSKDIQAGLEQLANTKFDKSFFTKAINESITEKGYKAPGSVNKTELGDVELGLKYQFINKPNRRVSTQIGLRLPTGSVSPIDDLFYQGTGGGAYALGALALHDYDFNSNWTSGLMIKTVAMLPDTRLRAVPLNQDDALPSLLPESGQVQRVERTQALDFESEASLTYNFDSRSWSLWGALQYDASGKDNFSGPGNLYYEGLESGTDFNRTDLELGFMYSSIPAYRKKAFPFPMKVETLYTTALSGNNSALISYLRTDLIVFF